MVIMVAVITSINTFGWAFCMCLNPDFISQNPHKNPRKSLLSGEIVFLNSWWVLPCAETQKCNAPSPSPLPHASPREEKPSARRACGSKWAWCGPLLLLLLLRGHRLCPAPVEGGLAWPRLGRPLAHKKIPCSLISALTRIKAACSPPPLAYLWLAHNLVGQGGVLFITTHTHTPPCPSQ